MTLITLEAVRDEWDACYPPERLAELYPVPRTPTEVLTLREGPWADVPDKDRVWTVTQRGVMSERALRRFAAGCAERALTAERARGRVPDKASWEAARIARLHADGKASDADLRMAWNDAEYAASSCARSDATGAAQAASTYAANARFVQEPRGRSMAALRRERRMQVDSLLELLKEETR